MNETNHHSIFTIGGRDCKVRRAAQIASVRAAIAIVAVSAIRSEKFTNSAQIDPAAASSPARSASRVDAATSDRDSKK